MRADSRGDDSPTARGSRSSRFRILSVPDTKGSSEISGRSDSLVRDTAACPYFLQLSGSAGVSSARVPSRVSSRVFLGLMMAGG